jgi:hypothetical protein
MNTESSKGDRFQRLLNDSDRRREWVRAWAQAVGAGVDDARFDKLWADFYALCDQGNIATSNRIRVSPSESVLLITAFNDNQLNSELMGMDLSKHVCVRRSRWEKSDYENAINILEGIEDDCIYEVRESIDVAGDIRIEAKISAEVKEIIRDRINGLPEGLVAVSCNYDQN